MILKQLPQKSRLLDQAQQGKEEAADELLPLVYEELRKLAAHNEALERLAARDPFKAEVVKLRYFVGLSQDEIAQALGVSVPTIRRHWAIARAWLYAEIKTRK
jgi:RNA polymerase sigma factor (sigma-70 family)